MTSVSIDRLDFEARRYWREALLFSVCGLTAIGLLMGATIDGPGVGFLAALKTRATRVLCGLIGLALMMRINLRLLRRMALPAYTTGVFLCLLPHVLGSATKGANRWIELGGFQFQPVELLKVLTVFATAEILERRRPYLDSFRKGVLPVIAVPLAGALALLTQPDIGHAFLVLAISGVVVCCGGMRARHGFVLAGTALAGLVLVLQFFGHSRNRMAEFSSGLPGFQIGRGLESFAEGSFAGVGVGASWIKMGWLPEARNDFVLAVIGNELGLVGSVLVLGLFVLFFVAAVQITLAARTPWSFLVALGIGVTIVLQACINILGVTFTVPEKGIDLPFLSSGGTNLVFALASVGILLNIARSSRASRTASAEARSGVH